MSFHGKLAIALAGIVAALNLIALAAGLASGDSGEWLDQVGKALLATWVITAVILSETWRKRALRAERLARTRSPWSAER
jgi:hypothetical protein